MYIDPNTGGMLVQTLAFCGICGIPFTLMSAAIAAVVYFVKKGKKNQQIDSTKDSTS